MLVEPSGAGKSRWAAAHLAAHEVISLDRIRDELGGRSDQRNNQQQVLRIAKQRLREGLRNKRKLAWDATSLLRDFRSPIHQLARDYGALVTQVYFHNSKSGYETGNRGREHAVPAKVLARQLSIIQWPEIHEAHRSLALDPEFRALAAFGFVDRRAPYGVTELPDMLHEARTLPAHTGITDDLRPS